MRYIYIYLIFFHCIFGDWAFAVSSSPPSRSKLCFATFAPRLARFITLEKTRKSEREREIESRRDCKRVWKGVWLTEWMKEMAAGKNSGRRHARSKEIWMSSSRLTTSLEACLPMEVANPNRIFFPLFSAPFCCSPFLSHHFMHLPAYLGDLLGLLNQGYHPLGLHARLLVVTREGQ